MYNTNNLFAPNMAIIVGSIVYVQISEVEAEEAFDIRQYKYDEQQFRVKGTLCSYWWHRGSKKFELKLISLQA